jgi:two-component system chemotaxis response regulator CheY
MSDSALDLGQCSILVIDDEVFTRSVLARLLFGLGAGRVHQAANGAEGLQIATECLPDLVFSDIEMQPVDGPEFLRRLRAHPDPRLRSVRLVFLTNRLDPAVAAEAATLGVTLSLTKPVRPGQLKETILAALAQPRWTPPEN